MCVSRKFPACTKLKNMKIVEARRARTTDTNLDFELILTELFVLIKCLSKVALRGKISEC